MKFSSTIRRTIVGFILVSTAACSVAASLGRLRGAAILGRPLDVAVDAQLGAGELPDALCATAEVFFGDTKISPARVRVVTEPAGTGSAGGGLLIRVRTTNPVDEPVVSVFVAEGCTQKTTRKYVMFADPLAETSPASPAAYPALSALAVTVPAPVGVQGLAVSPSSASSARASSAATAPAASVPPKVRKPRGAKPADTDDLGVPAPAAALRLPSARLTGQAPTRQAQPSGKNGRARLKLDALDLSIERDPVLRSSTELLSIPSTDDAQRQASAALWQALNAQPQDVLKDSQRLKALERDVSTLVAQNRSTQQAVASLKGQLEKARNERYNNWLVYVLGLLLALAVAVWMWRRTPAVDSERRGNPWWGKSEVIDSGQDASDLRTPVATNKGRVDAKSAALVPTDSSLDVDLEVDETLFDSLRHPSLANPLPGVPPLDPRDQNEFLPSLPGMPRPVNAEELFDVQQQADFFVTLGQFDQAIEVLRHHITDNVETSALAYLDLFDLYHRLQRTEDYELLRKDFNRVFNAQVPAMADYSTNDVGLDAYPSALSRIEALWPTPRVLEVIEESIFRKPDANAEAFNLTAYRELLLLYSVAKEIVERPVDLMDFEISLSSKPPSVDSSGYRGGATQFASTNIQPLSAEVQSGPSPLDNFAPDVDLTQPHASPRLGLDIDLSSDLPEPRAHAPKPQGRAERGAKAPKASTPVPIAAAPTPATAADPLAAGTGQATDSASNLIEFDVDSMNSQQPWPKDK